MSATTSPRLVDPDKNELEKMRKEYRAIIDTNNARILLLAFALISIVLSIVGINHNTASGQHFSDEGSAILRTEGANTK